ncbi:uncharacterized protein ARMOST_11702 [Armillaria ostoyae]|uniref:Reverse transcriptase Ty1/copia-type domain-containing protein n=1 Tax=Armillaria ostoyae TaxID=47428 RepID=A0A284RHU3_ARMOS|nr:uncharacterized protein ARMOST_11702 [Armillaria ostoyae]
MTSIHVILAYATQQDLDLFMFDVKTAFLNAELKQEIYIHQIPGYPNDDPSMVNRLLHALYGLKQSSHEWYNLLCAILLSLGLQCCDVDKAVFFGHWTVPPYSSIPMPSDSSPLLIIIPVYVNDRLTATNLTLLYHWLIMEINKHFEVKDLGPASMYLGIHIKCDRENQKIFLSQCPFITDLLTQYDMTKAAPSKVPLHSKLHDLSDPPPNTLPDIKDSDLIPTYQSLVRSLIYLAVCSRPDIAYTAMALGVFSSKPTHTHLLAAKGVLCYLAGTMNFALIYGGALPNDPMYHEHAVS